MIRIRIHLILRIRVELVAAPHNIVAAVGVMHVGEVKGPRDIARGERLGLAAALVFAQEQDAEDEQKY